MLKLAVGIKVVLDRLLAATGHQDDFRDIRDNRFFEDMLDTRPVKDRQELFWVALVVGSIRVPSPATGITAFLILTMRSSSIMGTFLDRFYLSSQGLNFRLKRSVLTLFAR